MYNFIEKCLRGDALLEDIDDSIDEWHESTADVPIYDYLGMSIEEYGAWVEDSDVLPYIVNAHKFRINLKDALSLSQTAAMAARSNKLDNTNLIMTWLNIKGLTK